MKHSAISIIVPVLNEAELIGAFLRHLRANAPGAELIVVDGGSSDDTATIATHLCDRFVVSESGRAAQMNAGVQHARGDVLWFLHADCEVPTGCLALLERALADSRIVGGYFRVRLPRPELIFRVHDSFGHHVGVLVRVRCGDHGIFCRRASFVAAGGYPDVPLMEDVKLYRKLHTLGRVTEIAERLIVSTRRHEQVGPYRYTAACVVVVALYCVGFPLASLARLYRHMVSRSVTATANHALQRL